MHRSPEAMEAATEIETEFGRKPGRSKVIRFGTILKSLPTTDARIVKSGLSNIDFSMTAEVLSVLGAINLENGLGSEDVPLKDRVEWTLRMAPFLSQLREGFSRKKGAKLPKTTAALAEETAKRSASIKKLVSALNKSPAESGKAAADELLPPAPKEEIDPIGDDDESDVDNECVENSDGN